MSERVAHVCLPEQVEQALHPSPVEIEPGKFVAGVARPIYAMCGVEWMPERFDSTSTVCAECARRRDAGWRFTLDGLPVQPGPYVPRG